MTQKYLSSIISLSLPWSPVPVVPLLYNTFKLSHSHNPDETKVKEFIRMGIIFFFRVSDARITSDFNVASVNKRWMSATAVYFFFSVLILACSCKVLNMLICDQVCENVITQLHIN